MPVAGEAATAGEPARNWFKFCNIPPKLNNTKELVALPEHEENQSACKSLHMKRRKFLQGN